MGALKNGLFLLCCVFGGILNAQNTVTEKWLYHLPFDEGYVAIKKLVMGDARFQLSKADSVLWSRPKTRDSLFLLKKYARAPLVVRIQSLAPELDRTKTDSAFMRMGWGSIRQTSFFKPRYNGEFKRIQVGYYSTDKAYLYALYKQALNELTQKGKQKNYYDTGATAKANSEAEGKVVEVRNNKSHYWLYKIIFRSYQSGTYELTVDVTLNE